VCGVNTLGLVLVGIAMAVGLAGIIVPILPGIILVWLAILVWALEEQSAIGWTILAVTGVLLILSQIVKYVLPGRDLSKAGIPNRTLWIGGLLALVGFFVIPVVGVFVGFIVGIYLAERMRLKTHEAAWPSTTAALKAAGVSILVELGFGVAMFLTWLITVLVT
jgi:uncharacterized protein